MVLYNLTVNVDLDVEVEWLNWMRESHIPKIMSTGIFIDHKIYRLLSGGEGEGISYAVQFFAKNLEDMNGYFELHGSEMSKELLERFRHKHVAFGTLLESIV